MQSRPKKQPYQKEQKISFFKQLSLTVVFLYVKLVLYSKGEETDVTIIFEIFGKSYVITYLNNREKGMHNARVFPVVPF